MRIEDTLILCTVLYEGQLKAVLGECRGSELRDSDLTVLASVLVISRLGCNLNVRELNSFISS